MEAKETNFPVKHNYYFQSQRFFFCITYRGIYVYPRGEIRKTVNFFYSHELKLSLSLKWSMSKFLSVEH